MNIIKNYWILVVYLIGSICSITACQQEDEAHKLERQQYRHGLYILGEIYEEGFGNIKRDYNKSTHHYNLATELGHPEASQKLKEAKNEAIIERGKEKKFIQEEANKTQAQKQVEDESKFQLVQESFKSLFEEIEEKNSGEANQKERRQENSQGLQNKDSEDIYQKIFLLITKLNYEYKYRLDEYENEISKLRNKLNEYEPKIKRWENIDDLT